MGIFLVMKFSFNNIDELLNSRLNFSRINLTTKNLINEAHAHNWRLAALHRQNLHVVRKLDGNHISLVFHSETFQNTHFERFENYQQRSMKVIFFIFKHWGTGECNIYQTNNMGSVLSYTIIPIESALKCFLYYFCSSESQ